MLNIGIVHVVLMLLLFGTILGLAYAYLPIPPVIKTVVNVLVILALIFFLLEVFGVTGGKVFHFHW